MLGATRQPHSCILITLDGLDKCKPHGATAILNVLLEGDVDHPKGLKILAASCPEAHLRKIFDGQRDIRKLSLEDVDTESDILHYLLTSFKQPPIHLVNPFTVSEETICKLAKRAGNSSFMWQLLSGSSLTTPIKVHKGWPTFFSVVVRIQRNTHAHT